MKTRPLGRTGISVPEVGFGAWGIGQKEWIGAEDEKSLRALHRAVDFGITFIDTALAYGQGHSEQLVGRLLKERKERIAVATKIYPKNLQWPALPDVPVDKVFPKDHIISCTETSLRNLGVEAIDLQQFHVWTDGFLDQGDWRSAVDQLKRQGKIRHFGVSLGEHTPNDGIRAVESEIVETVQVIYNIFDQSPEDRLFPACQKHQVGVLARVPLDEGGLTGTITPASSFPAEDFRNEYFAGDRKRQVQERVAKILADLDLPVERLPETALRFVLSHAAVSTVIPGMRTERHVEPNAKVGDGRGLPPEVVLKLRAHRWVRNFYEA